MHVSCNYKSKFYVTKISVDLILSFPNLTRLNIVEPNPQSSFYFIREAERLSSYDRQTTENITKKIYIQYSK